MACSTAATLSSSWSTTCAWWPEATGSSLSDPAQAMKVDELSPPECPSRFREQSEAPRRRISRGFWRHTCLPRLHRDFRYSSASATSAAKSRLGLLQGATGRLDGTFLGDKQQRLHDCVHMCPHGFPGLGWIARTQCLHDRSVFGDHRLDVRIARPFEQQ